MSNKTKVLFFLPSNTGGAEMMTVNIAKMLPLDKYEVKFVIVQRTLGTIVNFIPKGYEVLHIPIRNIYCATTLRMIVVLLKEKPDFVFCSLLHLNVRLLMASKICSVKTIVRNNIDLSRSSNKTALLLVRHTYKWAYKVIAQQEEMHDEIIAYTHIPENKVITLHNPIDTQIVEEKVKAGNPFTDNGTQTKYVCVGRFCKSKGQDLVIEAFGIVKNEIPNAHLYLIGKYDWTTPYDKSLKDYVNQHNLSDSVHFVGFDINPYRWIKNCDCYVMPSRNEGLPNSLIDAMYLRKPVVATKCIPVVSRIVKDGYNGILVETEDVKSIADGMVKALELRDFSMTYKPTTKEDFLKLFS